MVSIVSPAPTWTAPAVPHISPIPRAAPIVPIVDANREERPRTDSHRLSHAPFPPAQRTCSTEHLIANLFPSTTQARAFFVRFLACAESTQPSYGFHAHAGKEDIPHSEGAETAAIYTRSIQALAQRLGFSQDTTHRYVTLLRILGVLEKRTIGTQTAFVLYRGLYQPPHDLAANINALIERSHAKKSRGKLHRLAVAVKERCLLYGWLDECPLAGGQEKPETDDLQEGSEDIIPLLERLCDLLQPQAGETRRSLEQRLAQAQVFARSVMNQALAQLPHMQTTDPENSQLEVPYVAESASQRFSHREKRDERLSPSSMTSLHREQGMQRTGSSMGSISSIRTYLPQLAAQMEMRRHHQAVREDGADAENLPQPACLGDSAQMAIGNLPQSTDKGDVNMGRDLPQRATGGDFPEVKNLLQYANKRASSTRNLPPSVSSVDFSQIERKNLPQRAPRVDFSAAGNLPQSASSGDSSDGGNLLPSTCEEASTQIESENPPQSTNEGDSTTSLRLRKRNITLLEFFKTLTLRTATQLATFLAEQLEHDPSAFPKYLKLVFVQEGQVCDPQVLLAAFICTMVRLHRDQWNIAARPGGFFTKRYREYLAAGIPAEVATWVERYGHLPPDQLLEALHSPGDSALSAIPTPPVSGIGATGVVRSTMSVRGTTAGNGSAPPALTASSSERSGRVVPATLPPERILAPSTRVEQEKMVMSKQEAQELLTFIRADEHTRLYHAWCIPSEDHEHYAVVVDASLYHDAPRRQTITYSAAEWQQRLSSMRTWRDLICPDAQAVPFAQYRASIQASIQRAREVVSERRRREVQR